MAPLQLGRCLGPLASHLQAQPLCLVQGAAADHGCSHNYSSWKTYLALLKHFSDVLSATLVASQSSNKEAVQGAQAP